ncbi:hypothetical protein GCM10009716_12060 [Streptomyces sodiiphilus]|uniref:Acetoacetate decarboxylase n=1 Tax=Streptomyces sodiiphilus TaxID=226217 RepID=A0ABN2NYZ5_9ACTN
MPGPQHTEPIPGVLPFTPGNGPEWPDAPPPGPPWHCRVDALVWWYPAPRAARRALPDNLAHRRLLPVAVGMWLRYLDSPVGRYDEVAASPALLADPLPHGHVPFIAVDSATSVRAGREHWALPKTRARFEGDPGGSEPLRAAGDGWRVEARPRPRGPRVPLRLAWATVQEHADGTLSRTGLRLAGRGRAAGLPVSVTGPHALTDWFRGGRHRAVQFTDAHLTVLPPRPVRD